MHKIRNGSIFLFVLAVMGVLFALAMGLMRSASISSISRLETDPMFLADQAAQEGVGHAIGVIHRDFLRGQSSSSGLTSTFHDDWRLHFWPIDAFDKGVEEDDAPVSDIGLTPGGIRDHYDRGDEHSPEDWYQNDSPAENYINEMYANTKNEWGVYWERQNIYAGGNSTHPGVGRWWEPGKRTADPVSHPLSFHFMDHPAPADATSLDPALWRDMTKLGRANSPGENYQPNQAGDANRPVRYDQDFRPTMEEEKIRYRLRYAIAVEPIDGHVLNALPDAYPEDVSSIASAAGTSYADLPVPTGFGSSSTPTVAGLSSTLEHDGDRSATYGPYFHEMVKYARLHNPDASELAWRGLGYRADIADDSDAQTISPMLAAYGSGSLQGHHASGSGPMDSVNAVAAIAGDDVRASWELMGPIPSYDAWMMDGGTGAESRDGAIARGYNFQPFIRAPQPVEPGVVPSLWFHARPGVDVPWRFNVPVMAPKTFVRLLAPYLPEEAKTAAMVAEVDQWNDGTKWWDMAERPISPPIAESFTDFNPFSAHSQLGGRFDLAAASAAQNGSEKYPGTDTQYNGVWQGTEGATCYANVDTEWNANTTSWNWGRFGLAVSSIHSYHLRSGHFPICDQPFFGAVINSNGARRTVRVPGGNTHSGGPGYSGQYFNRKFGGQYYDDSYWQDIATAYLAAMNVAGYSWLNVRDYRYLPNGDQPYESGRPIWTDVEPNYFGTFPSGMLEYCQDLDLDGDGVMETPEAFNSIEDLDRQFLRNLGEAWGDVAVRPLTATKALIFTHNVGYKGLERGVKTKMLKPMATAGTLKSQASHGRITPHLADEFQTTTSQPDTLPIYGMLSVDTDGDGNNDINADQARLMELIVNDFRMSFFGSSPQYEGPYSDGFRPIDFDGDGLAYCTAYAAPYSRAVEPGSTFGQALAPDGTDAGDKYFSLTGHAVFQKSRYYRIFVRGEVFDEVRKLPVAQSNLETVYVVDPDGDVFDINNNYTGSSTSSGMRDSHVIFQRKLYNSHRGAMSHADR